MAKQPKKERKGSGSYSSLQGHDPSDLMASRKTLLVFSRFVFIMYI